MPVTNGVGHSAYTPIKQEQFRYILRTWIPIVHSISDRLGDGRFFYVDLTAGPGYSDGDAGSPILFMHEATEKSCPYRAVFCEQNEANARRLHRYVTALKAPARVFINDNRNVLQLLADENREKRKSYDGLVYWDDNGSTQMPHDELYALFSLPAFRRVDFLANISATSRKRLLGTGRETPRLMDELRMIGKAHIMLRTPMDKHQWTFALCTNWDKAPELRQLRFHNVNTRAGKELAAYLNLTREEYDARPFRPDAVPNLFGVPEDPGVPGCACNRDETRCRKV